MKKIHRFLESVSSDKTQRISDQRIVHHIARVLKLKPGEEIILFSDGGSERLVKIELITADEIRYTSLQTRENVSTPLREVVAAISVIKNDHFEFVVQKLSELGIAEIQPLITDRTVKVGVRNERLQAISDEAVELSGGTRRIKIHEPLPLAKAVDVFSALPWIICEQGTTVAAPFPKKCVYAVGPEGGWSEAELQLFTAHQAQYWSLTPRILRAETAAILGGYKLLWE